jgi:hypothetical protein
MTICPIQRVNFLIPRLFRFLFYPTDVSSLNESIIWLNLLTNIYLNHHLHYSKFLLRFQSQQFSLQLNEIPKCLQALNLHDISPFNEEILSQASFNKLHS